jgi:tetratricopeptide (TPR) repeat protein
MPSKEIKELRQSGRLDEALEMAQNELNAQPDNIWGKRNISWVYYEYLKKYAHEFNYEGFIEYLTKLKELNLPENEVMVFDASAWQIGKMLFAISNNSNLNDKSFQQAKEYFDALDKVKELLDLIKEFHFSKPSNPFSFLFKAFHKFLKAQAGIYVEFCDWWNFHNFRNEDYLEEEYNGRQVMSIVEQAYIAYAKSLIEGDRLPSEGLSKKLDITKAKEFLSKLDELIIKHPEYKYPPYFKAKLLLALGSEENVLSSFLPFAKQKRNDFWVWEMMAEIYKDDREMAFACYCKALSLKTPEDFLINIRESFAEILIERKLYSDAKTEIEQIVSTRNSHNWKLPNQITNWMKQIWYTSSEAKKNNFDLYKAHLEKAEEILYQDTPELIVAVEFVNKDRKILNFIKDQTFNGFFSYKGFNIKPQIGDLLKVRLEQKGNEGFFRALTIKTTEKKDLDNCEAIKQVSGSIRIPDGKSFGFLEDIFIDPDLVKRFNLKDTDEIACKAIQSFNKKKDEWGWKCFEIKTK